MYICSKKRFEEKSITFLLIILHNGHGKKEIKRCKINRGQELFH